MQTMTPVLIDPVDLAEELLGAAPPVVLDIRWQLGDFDGREHYAAGHLPGAIYVDLDTELAAPATPGSGRHPLPDVADLQEAARRWGLDDATPVVVYDDTGNLAAARAWWLLRWAGHDDVRLLDGGLGAWQAAGLRVSRGNTDIRPGTITLTGGALPTATVDETAAAAAATEVPVLDARAGERYRGEVEPVDPRAGHIPGARSAPTADNLDADGRFLSAADLRARFAHLGVTDEAPPIVYCGSGINACHQLVALEIAGLSGTLFPGSWSQYAADPERPVAP